MRQVEENDAAGGSIPYMGPEMFGSKSESVNATDIWALGASLYEMCEGELPFFGQGGGMQLNGAQIPEIRGNYSDDLKQIVQMCLAKETWDRPTASQLREYAQAKMEGQTLPDYGGMTPPPPPPPQPLYGNGGYPSGDYASGGYPSGGGQVYVSGNGTSLEGFEQTKKKKGKVIGWIAGIAAAIVIAFVAVQMMKPSESPEQRAARENQTIYTSKVNICQQHINEGSYQGKNYKVLLTAKEELDEIKRLEDAGREFYPDTYNRYDPMKCQLDKKMQEIGQKYANHAIGYIGLDDDMAKDEFKIAKQLYPNYTSPEYEKLMRNN